MARRNWTWIIAGASTVGGTAFGLLSFGWGLFGSVAAPIAVAGYLLWRDGKGSEELENDRLMAMLHQPVAPPAPEPAAPPKTSEPLTRQAVAARSIELALRSSDPGLAAGLLREFAAVRGTLKLTPQAWTRIGNAALEQRAFMDAAWALHASAVLAGDPAAAQKRLVEIAGKAAAAGDSVAALKLYGTLLAKYPASAHAELARSSIAAEKQKLMQTQSSA